MIYGVTNSRIRRGRLPFGLGNRPMFFGKDETGDGRKDRSRGGRVRIGFEVVTTQRVGVYRPTLWKIGVIQRDTSMTRYGSRESSATGKGLQRETGVRGERNGSSLTAHDKQTKTGRLYDTDRTMTLDLKKRDVSGEVYHPYVTFKRLPFSPPSSCPTRDRDI